MNHFECFQCMFYITVHGAHHQLPRDVRYEPSHIVMYCVYFIECLEFVICTLNNHVGIGPMYVCNYIFLTLDILVGLGH